MMYLAYQLVGRIFSIKSMNGCFIVGWWVDVLGQELYRYTLPETNGLHLKIDGWKMYFLLK